MLGFVRRIAHWVGRHSLPAAAATVVVVAAAGGGIGYTVAGQHTATAASTSTTPAGGSATRPSTGPSSKSRPGEAVIARMVKRLAAEINVPVATVRTELKTKSINDVVAAAGKDPATIEAGIMAQLQARGDRAVTAGRITAQQETTWLAMAKPEVEKLMAEAPAQRTTDIRTLLQTLRAHQPKVAAPAP
jgi:hypothetical protein